MIGSVRELNRMLLDSSLDGKTVIVDTRSLSEYLDGHIPGAINIDLMQFHWIDTSKIGISQFNRQMKILLSHLGLTDTMFTVFYENISGPSASRGVWLSQYFSHLNSIILDGGLTEWKAEGLEIQKESNSFTHSKLTATPNSEVLADLKMIESSLKEGSGSRKYVLLDCRSKQEFDGNLVRALRRGHIPNAINIDWSCNIDDENNGKFKSMSDLAEIYSGIAKTDKVITYCQGGYRAANTFIVLKTLGYERVRMYPGSWGEWGNTPHLPAQRSDL
ncbi:MAG TPA: rhodanese-like domain-containing protein [Nitrososphaeraceae archaeon]|nr:rhodanese-like domain-containing protein [Nitrososphaeraceae archaeon]